MKILSELSTQEFRALNGEYLGAYLFGAHDAWGHRLLSVKDYLAGAARLFTESVTLLRTFDVVTDGERDALMGLLAQPCGTKEQAKQKIRDILKTKKSDVAWLGNV